ncbi:hypothetical protein ACFZC3_24065 [Streptomyces sp. NPDC007903]|uniref:hypothetical protein n=1 Tax=Streptomyces sp. NPDC007903 TaxID=3364786 RepID=UPI0036EAA48F
MFCFFIGRNGGSVRLGWLFFLLLGPLPIATMFAFIGAVVPAIAAGVVAGLIIFLMILDWYGDDPSDPDTDQLTD